MVKKFFKSHPVHKKIVPHLDNIFLLRPTLFFSVWVMVVIGMAAATMTIVENPLWLTGISWSTIFLFTGLTFVCGSAFILNQIADVESDRVNQKLFLVGNSIDLEKSAKLGKVLLGIGIIFSVLGNWAAAIIIIVIYLFWGILYNNPSFAWKNNPILGWVTNSIVGILLFIVGWVHVYHGTQQSLLPLSNPNIFKIMLPYLLSFSAVSLLTTIPDMKGDRASGSNTFPLVFGKVPAILLALLLIAFAFVAALKNADPLASSATIVSLPFFIFTAVRRLDRDILRSIRYPIFILNFFTMAVYPWLFIPVFFVFYVSKYYYWHRFNIHYPTFLVDHD